MRFDGYGGQRERMRWKSSSRRHPLAISIMSHPSLAYPGMVQIDLNGSSGTDLVRRREELGDDEVLTCVEAYINPYPPRPCPLHLGCTDILSE